MRRGRTTGAALSVSALAATTLEGLAKEWLEQVRAAPSKVTARQLYVGRAFSEALTVARAVDGEIFVVSAGLGLIHESDHVPNYNASVAEGNSSLKAKLKLANATSSEWWQALASLKGTNGSLDQLLRNKRPSIVLIALPSAYLDLVSDDIARIPEDYIERLRVFTSPSSAERLPIALRKTVMPYDDRLEGSTRPGTRNDFAQRAMRHFVEDLNAASLSLNDASARVRDSIAQLKRREVPTRQRKSDTEVLELLKNNWDRFQGSSSRLLRFLRDEALVACEQGRFRGLWLQLRSAMKSQESSVHA